MVGLKLDCITSRSSREEEERGTKKGQSTLFLVPLSASHTEQTFLLHAGHTSITRDKGLHGKLNDNIQEHVLDLHSL